MGRFILFITTFTLIYAAMHAYPFLKARRVFPLPSGVTLALFFFMGLMLFCPILIRILERFGLEILARAFAYVGYTWMGFLFLFVSASLVMDIGLLSAKWGGLALSIRNPPAVLSNSYTFGIALCLAAGISLYGYFQALDIRSEHIRITSPKIPREAGSIRLAQISDVHLGLLVGKARLERIMERVSAAGPDILIATGDLVDGQLDDISGLIGMFRNFHPKHGKFAIMGNHEYYAGPDRAIHFMEAAGFRVLRGEGAEIPGLLNLAGVDDPARSSFGAAGMIPEKVLLSKFDPGKFTILLKHRPLLDEESIPLFDLQLSGHTHKGQVFPFNLVVKLFFPFDSGLHRLAPGTDLYVSRGSGTWGPPIRFRAPPEVTVIELVHGG